MSQTSRRGPSESEEYANDDASVVGAREFRAKLLAIAEAYEAGIGGDLDRKSTV